MKKTIVFLFAVFALMSCEDVVEINEANSSVQLDVSSSYVVFDCDGGSKTVLVASNNDWNYVSDATWFSVSRNDINLEITSSANATASSRYGEITVATSDGVISKTISVAQLVAGDAIDLSAGECANCYMAKTDATYCFNATVKGNGVNTEGGAEAYIGKYGQTISSDEIVYAQLLWEATLDADKTRSCNIIDNEPIYNNGYVYFTTGTAEGNAVIAVKNSLGEILWSWHIWVTDADVNEIEGGGFYWMDRNLGALSAEPLDINNRGLLYQWGRKDPFLPSLAEYGEQASNVVNTEVGNGRGSWIYSGYSTKFASEAPGNIQLSVKNPMNVLLTRGSDVYAWYLTEANDDHNGNYLWGDSSNLATYVKSMFDPCPAGYNVPVEGAWTSVDSSQWTVEEETYGRNWITGNNAFYPFAGGIDGITGTLQNTSVYGYYWTSAMYVPYSYTTMYLYFNNSSTLSYTYTYPAHAYSVRCMRVD